MSTTIIESKGRVKKSNNSAIRYQNRNRKRDQAEKKLVSRALSHLATYKSLLDTPCGNGRMSFLAESLGFKVCSTDLGDGVLHMAQIQSKALESDVVFIKSDIFNMPFDNYSFDIVLCFRYFHHLSSQEKREGLIKELVRVSSSYVIISYLSDKSVTGLKRSIRKKFLNKKSVQNHTSLSELKTYFEHKGLALDAHYSQIPFFRSLNLAVFKKII